jgi:hypothetical protein
LTAPDGLKNRPTYPPSLPQALTYTARAPSYPKPGDIVEHQRPGDWAIGPKPGKKLLSLSPDGEWAFLEGVSQGVPASELRVMRSQEEIGADQKKVPPPNPHLQKPPQERGGGVTREASASWAGPCVRFDLPRQNVIEIRLKAKVTPGEFAKIKRIFDLSEVAFVMDEEEQKAGAHQDRPSADDE